MQLVVPALEHLPSYVDALNRGWSPDNIRGRAAALDGTLALAQMLENARAEGLEYVEITTDLDNDGSRRVIERNGGVLVGRFRKAAHYGGKESLRYRIDLTVKHALEQTPFDDHD